LKQFKKLRHDCGAVCTHELIEPSVNSPHDEPIPLDIKTETLPLQEITDCNELIPENADLQPKSELILGKNGELFVKNTYSNGEIRVFKGNKN